MFRVVFFFVGRLLRPPGERFLSHDDKFEVFFLAGLKDAEGVDKNEAWRGWRHVDFVIICTSIYF